ncbi:60S ribosomal protein l15 [Phtheirospermum japonicum]|uniref:Ribosomal protein L15 n=1 Tax=Phtheirospermum japonicum TaxID=374723 RepID=A0A830CQP0_9LAMI|nr:60S ribosomal protein l15 [Phtheirospermum japonicum]
MGAYIYISELWKKKQSDVMWFLLRVRCWEYRQLPPVVHVTHPTRPDKGYVVYRVRVRRGEGRGLSPRVLSMANPQTRELLSSNFIAARDQLLRSVLAGNWVVSGL